MDVSHALAVRRGYADPSECVGIGAVLCNVAIGFPPYYFSFLKNSPLSICFLSPCSALTMPFRGLPFRRVFRRALAPWPHLPGWSSRRQSPCWSATLAENAAWPKAAPLSALFMSTWKWSRMSRADFARGSVLCTMWWRRGRLSGRSRSSPCSASGLLAFFALFPVCEDFHPALPASPLALSAALNGSSSPF